MTEQTQPTDAELIDVWAQFVGDPTPKLPLTDADKAAFARAVLAKWGTPSAVTPQPTQAQAGAPRVSPEQWQALFDDQKRLVELANSRADIAESMLKAVQAQAGAVPLTDEQIEAAVPEYYVDDVLDFKGGARFAERHHGIKGGQHGADT